MTKEQSKKFELPSGSSLVVTVAPFADAWALMRASLKSLKGMALSQEDLNRDFAALSGAMTGVPAIFDRIITFATSDEVEVAMFKCAQRALYIPPGSPDGFPGMKVDRGLFDDAEHGDRAREDYALIVVRLLEVNCKPFLARVLSGFSAPTTPSSLAGQGRPLS